MLRSRKSGGGPVIAKHPATILPGQKHLGSFDNLSLVADHLTGQLCQLDPKGAALAALPKNEVLTITLRLSIPFHIVSLYHINRALLHQFKVEPIMSIDQFRSEL